MTDFPNTVRGLVRLHLKDGLPISLEHPQYRWMKGHVLIAGEAHSGKTNAMIRTMVNMIKASKVEPEAKKLVIIGVREEPSAVIYDMIATHLTDCNMWGSTSSFNIVDTWMSLRGFSLIVQELPDMDLRSIKAMLISDHDVTHVFIDTAGANRAEMEEVAALRDCFTGALVFTMPLHRHRESNDLQSNIPEAYKAAVSGEEQSRIVSGADLALYTTAHPDGSVRLNFLCKPDDATEDSFQIFTDPLSKERAYIAQQRIKEPECGPQ